MEIHMEQQISVNITPILLLLEYDILTNDLLSCYGNFLIFSCICNVFSQVYSEEIIYPYGLMEVYFLLNPDTGQFSQCNFVSKIKIMPKLH